MTIDNDDIVFEDLHGQPDESSVEVDLDAEKDGIRRVAPQDGLDSEDADTNDSDDDPGLDAADDDESDDDDDDRALSASDDDEDEEEDDQPSSRNTFQKRLDRERRAKLKARREADDARREAAQLRRQLTDQSRTISESEQKAIDDSITSVKAQLTAAYENGDTAKQVELTEQLSELKAKKLFAERQAPPQEDRSSQSGPPELAQKWMKKNGSWFQRSGFERYTRAANEIDQELYADGYDVNSPDYYRELDKRLAKRHPDFFDSGTPRKKQKRRDTRTTVAGVDGAQDDRRSRRALSGRIELGPEDFRLMRSFGLNPDDPAHLKEFAASRRERLAQERADRRGR